MRQYLNIAILFLSFNFIAQSVTGQIGIRTKYLKNSIASDVQDRFNAVNNLDEEILNSGFGIGVDYWFRLKDKRIEFLPEIEYTVSSSATKALLPRVKDISNTTFGINLNTRIYPMDFDGDCDCPTFSNQSTLIKKGFYFEFSPGVIFNRLDYDFAPLAIDAPQESDYTSFDNLHLSYKIGIGVGLDIGVSNLITLNPYAIFNYHISNVPDNTTFIIVDKPYGNFTQIELGLRFAIRFDAKKY